MAEITHGGLWVRWSSLNRRDKRDFGGGFVLFFLGGLMVGLMAGRYQDAPLAVSAGNVALALSPLLPLLVGGILYSRFVRRQDELFRMFHVLTSLWGGIGALAVLVPGLLLNKLLGVSWIGLEHVLIGAGVASVISGFVLSRRYF